MIYTATYSPEDNKIRLSASSRLPVDVYDRVKAAGFRWAPKQNIFVAPMWTPQRADFAEELAGEIGDEDTTLAERAEQRAERFDEYHDKRTADAESAHSAIKRLADGIPLGQPILVGHHSERHARKDAERIENGMRRAVKMWETAEYWTRRAAGAISHAKYKERPDVRARRIKRIEADLRKVERSDKESARGLLLRWAEHYKNRLAYERAMLADAGGTVAQRTGPEVGGGCQCWASPGHGAGWSYIQKVNKVSVTVLDNWGNGGPCFKRTIPFDKLRRILPAAEVAQARAEGRIKDTADKTGFYLLESRPDFDKRAAGRE